jgi:DNA-binding MarR family transcriptional regulator
MLRRQFQLTSQLTRANFYWKNRFPKQESSMPCVKESECITPWICLISRLSTLFVGREMTRLGFGPGQFFFLTALYGEEGLSQDELSRRVGVDKSNTSRALAKLEQYGLVRRQSDPHNHRVKKVFLEPEALKVRNALKKIAVNAETVLCAGQPPELVSAEPQKQSA